MYQECNHENVRIWCQQHCDGTEWIHGVCEYCHNPICPFEPPDFAMILPGARDTNAEWKNIKSDDLERTFGSFQYLTDLIRSENQLGE